MSHQGSSKDKVNSPSRFAESQLDSNRLTVVARKDESTEQAIARTALTPAVKAAGTLKDLSKQLPGVELDALVDQLGAQQAKAVGGDLEDCCAMLVAQAQTLDALFHKLTGKAFSCPDFEYSRTCLHLALKAQNSARNTLLALASIQQPKGTTFVKQANVQVNHGLTAVAPQLLSSGDSSASLFHGISSPENELKKEAAAREAVVS